LNNLVYFLRKPQATSVSVDITPSIEKDKVGP
jgi:hypothetical protein